MALIGHRPVVPGGVRGADAGGGSTYGWGQASNIGRSLLVISALGVPAIHADWTGDLQAGESLLLSAATAAGLKQVFPEERPDRSDRKSFPSGHTALSFAAAATLENRYGWKVGFPALAVASLVGVSRVEARKHHWYDAVAGAAIGTGSGLLLTSRRDDAIQLTPWAERVGGGLALAMRF